MVVGVTSRAELAAVLDATAAACPLPAAFDRLAADDEALLDPSRWPPA
jgi:hypothetical protein